MRQIVMVDPYTTLGLSPTATQREIKTAFRRIAQECHPDRAGDDQASSERFKEARAAYEVLIDPKARSRHDRRARRARRGGGLDWGPFMRRDEPRSSPPPPDRGNDLDLDDLFGDGFVDFGFGSGRFGGRSRGTEATPVRRKSASSRRPSKRQSEPASKPAPEAVPGQDVIVYIDVSPEVVETGGSILVSYTRMRRKDGSLELYAYDEIHDVRVTPGVEPGDSLRFSQMGHAGIGGGPYGDLVAEIRLVPGVGGEDLSGRVEPAAAGSLMRPEELRLSVAEALLGARIQVGTPGGLLWLKVPPCTSSGRIFRFRDKGVPTQDGLLTDFYVEAVLVTPDSLDEESQSLIRAFAERNGEDPREKE